VAVGLAAVAVAGALVSALGRLAPVGEALLVAGLARLGDRLGLS
jgi:hypothetical protein